MLANWKWHGSWSFKSQNRRRTWNGMQKKNKKGHVGNTKRQCRQCRLKQKKQKQHVSKKCGWQKKTPRKVGELCFWWLSLTDSSWRSKFQGIFVAKQTYLVLSNLPIGNSQTDEPTKTEKQFGTWKISAIVRYTKTPLTCNGCFFSTAWVAQKFKDWLYVFGPGPQIYSIYVHVWNCKCWIPKIYIYRFSVDSQSLCT